MTSPYRRGYRHSTLHLRVSDAERADVADRLSKNYADGRLDQAEFNERLDQAMSAKTQADLHGLFADLPADDGAAMATHQHRGSRPSNHLLLFVVLLVAIAATVGPIVAHLYHPWLLAGVLIVVLLLRHDRQHRRR